MGPSVRFSGGAATDPHFAGSLVQRLNAYAPAIVQLVDNGVDLYTAVGRALAAFNQQNGQAAQVTAQPAAPAPTPAPAPAPRPVPQPGFPVQFPVLQAFWDYNYRQFRLAQWNPHYQTWQWM